MKFSVIVPSFNSARYLEESLKSILVQRQEGIDLELIVVDGNSRDKTSRILEQYAGQIDQLIVEEDDGPAHAINKGLQLAQGDIISWLNADDLYTSCALHRVLAVFSEHQSIGFCFGRCRMINGHGEEIRQGITAFKEFFFPFSSRFTYQCINYISQPAMFFRKSALERIGALRMDMVAAWDYEFILRLWRQGKGVSIQGDPLAAFRWHEQSISGQHFALQFKEEFDAAVEDAGRGSLQSIIHACVRWGIVGVYSAMQMKRSRTVAKG
ncbi:glycosyltransferase family 2 protein [Desulfogranum mediterraneum]|uniref:glycosyltransferase family 2 protein n=1 Tax=Desulfogranum mediterraneum TaxID=160661 RepID=UPI000409098A|nr:glycosyltransferase family 2 protein [Desulfogranum mediterraneum]